MRRQCKSRECGTALTALNRSPNDPAYCIDCGELVWAFRPNRDLPDEWFHIPDLSDGTVVDGDQCEGCGLSSYTVRRLSDRLWVAVCEGQEWDGEEIKGCQTQHPVRQKLTAQVIF